SARHKHGDRHSAAAVRRETSAAPLNAADCAQSRCLTHTVAATLDETFFAPPVAEGATARPTDVRVDVARSLRSMW
ncbi:MAG: hypothetical protein AAFZ58_15365, partial [Pseudomonadota bacterium]